MTFEISLTFLQVLQALQCAPRLAIAKLKAIVYYRFSSIHEEMCAVQPIAGSFMER